MTGMNITCTYKGIMVKISPEFPSDFYSRFIERCGHQIDEVLSLLNEGYPPVQCLEVQPEKMLVHFQTLAGHLYPTYPTMIRWVLWVYPPREHMGIPMDFNEWEQLFLEYGTNCACDGALDDGCPLCTEKKLTQWLKSLRNQESIQFKFGEEEYLKISRVGFYVRGKLVKRGEEAEEVWRNMRDFLRLCATERVLEEEQGGSDAHEGKPTN